MLENILKLVEKLNLKWWISLKSQQMLTVFMAVLIIVFFSTSTWLFIKVLTLNHEWQDKMDEKMRSNAVELNIERSKTDDCKEKTIRSMEKWELLFYETEILKKEIKPKNYENTTS